MWIKRLSNTRQLIAWLIQVAVIALSVIGKLTDNVLAALFLAAHITDKILDYKESLTKDE
jgi:hypothetical protein